MNTRPPAPMAVALGLAAALLPVAPLAAQTPPPASAPARPRVQVMRTTTPIVVDGKLDDAAWRLAVPARDFVQGEPDTGKPASEATEVRLVMDDDTLYVGAYLHDRVARGQVVSEIRKDFKPEDQDTFEVILDTFGDRRNGFLFATNVEGARADQQVANEGREVNASWDAVWFVRTARVEDGWTAELAIPLKSLRFEPGATVPWGVNFSRRIRRTNEVDYWAPVPRAYTLSRVSLAGEIAGMGAIAPGRNLRIKPYVLGSDTRGTGAARYDGDLDAGVDLKYGVTPALTLDVTALPDFAQAEADEQQVNLTQFSQFFPEKRDFFLENSGQFYVGDTARNNRVNPSPTPDEDLLLFHSRRIGLSASGAPVPIWGGVRLTGQAAGFGVGALTIQTSDHGGTPGDNYTVLRVRRNVGRSNDVGAIYMHRQSAGTADDFNRVFGADATFRFLGNLDWNLYGVKTQTPGGGDGQWAARTSLNYESQFFHGKGGIMSLGDNFNDELGYYRRVGARKWFVDTGVRPRSKALRAKGIREIHPHITWNYYEDQQGRMVGKRLHSGLSFFFNNGGFTELSVNPEYERIDAPLVIHSGDRPIPVGGYSWNEWQWRLTTDPSKRLSGTVTLIEGGLWSGSQHTQNVTMTVRASHRLRATVGLQRTDATLDLPAIDFVTALWTVRANYSFTTNMFLDSLLQWDQDRHRLNSNVRFNLIHRPLSDLFVVYNEQRVQVPGQPVAPGRGLIVKFTEMLAF